MVGDCFLSEGGGSRAHGDAEGCVKRRNGWNANTIWRLFERHSECRHAGRGGRYLSSAHILLERFLGARIAAFSQKR